MAPPRKSQHFRERSVLIQVERRGQPVGSGLILSRPGALAKANWLLFAPAVDRWVERFDAWVGERLKR